MTPDHVKRLASRTEADANKADERGSALRLRRYAADLRAGKVRYLNGLKVEDVHPPRKKGHCVCGCGAKLPPRRRKWASDACQAKAVRRFLILKGDAQVIRNALRERDLGICDSCCTQVEVLACEWPQRTWVEMGDMQGIRVVDRIKPWEAHHVVAVAEGGGGCGLDGYTTMCRSCHGPETGRLRRRLNRAGNSSASN